MRNVNAELLFLQILETAKNIMDDKDLKKTLVDAYALSEIEKGKRDEAMAIIAKSDEFLANIKAKEDALADVDLRIAEARKIEASNEDKLKQISDRSGELDRRELSLATAKSLNDSEKLALTEWKDSLTTRENELKLAEQKFAAAKADLKKRADKVKATTADL